MIEVDHSKCKCKGTPHLLMAEAATCIYAVSKDIERCAKEGCRDIVHEHFKELIIGVLDGKFDESSVAVTIMNDITGKQD